jgi:hypothetical protein
VNELGFYGGGFCISKAFVYILLPLDLRANGKIHERERTRNCIICLCYLIYLSAQDSPRIIRGEQIDLRDCHLSLLDPAVHLLGCLFIYIAGLSTKFPAVALPWPLIDITFDVFSIILQAI